MSTIRQKQAIKNLRNSTTREEAMIKAGYSESYARTGQIKQTKGWQYLMEKSLPDTDLLKVHKEGLEATKIITSHTEPDYKYPDFAVRHKYLETAYKIKNRFQDNFIAEQKVLDVRITQIINKIYGVRRDSD